ncbi:MAG: 3'-5' exonuclease [Candidatus Izemoplasma sp.]
MRDYVVLDIETTGLSKENDRIVELGAVRIKDGKVVATYNELINPGISIPYEVSKINGITDDMLVDSLHSYEAFLKFENFILGTQFLVGHNIYYFDYPFLQNEFKRSGINLNKHKIEDTLWIAKKKVKGLNSYSLKNLTAKYNIDNVTAHRALSDVMATYELFELLNKI